MTDYIKRENAKRAVWGCTRDTGIDEAPFEYAEGLLEDVPAEDVEPVVRCKDCKWYQDNATWEDFINHCKWISTETPDEYDFCSCGERKDNDKR